MELTRNPFRLVFTLPDLFLSLSAPQVIKTES